MKSENTSNSEYTGYIHDGSARITTGSSLKPRKCRFCGKSEPEVSFDNDTAHAISESLGNTNFICIDECKSCNHLFSNIEQSFYRAHAPMLMMCGIEGKNNGKRKNEYKTLAGADCRISLSDKGLLIHLKDEGYKKFCADVNSEHTFSIDPLLKFEKFKPIDIYKSLCKYIISMLSTQQLENFRPTIEWLLGKRTFEKLPAVLSTITPLTQHPKIGYLIRKDKSNYPYAIAFFRFAMLTYLFVIPGANDEFDYPSTEWLIDVANRITHGTTTWKIIELNSDIKEAPKFPIEINNIHFGTTCFAGTKEQFGFK